MAKKPQKSSNQAKTDPPVTPGKSVQTGASIEAAQPTSVETERAINAESDKGEAATEALKPAKPKPMPKDFAPEVSVEGSRVVLRHKGAETAFRNTDDKKAYDEALKAAQAQLWDAVG